MAAADSRCPHDARRVGHSERRWRHQPHRADPLLASPTDPAAVQNAGFPLPGGGREEMSLLLNWQRRSRTSALLAGLLAASALVFAACGGGGGGASSSDAGT